MKKVFALALSGATLLHTMCGTNSVNETYGDAARVSYVCSDFLTGITVLK
ncbi:hypothetical protein [Agathobacter ruminis]|nr:hypothetical protein [Agathobacter ruminis]MDC7300296.1 hypothetical protein [Agathobacter ruminis]